ncbi:MAG: hypothetical protein AAF481_10260 [Acidobacteriota bacterium]
MTSLLSVFLLTLVSGGVGWLVEKAFSNEDDRSLDRWGRRLALGLVWIFGALLLMDLLSVRWTRGSVGVVVALIAGGLWFDGWRSRTASGRPAGLRSSFGWGDLAALGTVILYGFIAAGRQIGLPDFVYHWGIKAHRSFLAGGIDWHFLSDSLHLAAHPDYPHLVPTLTALSSLIEGRFAEGGAMLWSAVFFAAMLLAGRETLRRAGADAFSAQAGIAVLALVTAMFGIGYRMAGAADWPIALAIVLALPALLSPLARSSPQPSAARTDAPASAASFDLSAPRRTSSTPVSLRGPHSLQLQAPAPSRDEVGEKVGLGRADDLRVSAAAALATAAKIEGPVLAGVLLGVWIALRWRRSGWSWRRLFGLVLMPAVVGLPWLAMSARHGLFQATNSGAPDLGRAATIAAGLVEALQTIEWHAVPWLLVVLPWLLVLRRTRIAALVIAGQLAFYLAVYFTAPVDVDFYVRSSFPRLLFHLVPALLIVGTVALAVPGRSAAPRTARNRRR